MMLTDRFGRIHNYLRISLTEACNLRCKYCMPEDYTFPRALPAHYMTAGEIEKIVGVFTKLGVNKIRLTGGEPLARQDARDIFQRLSAFNGITLAVSTNGLMAHRFITSFKEANVRSVNMSLDTMMPERFEAITRRNSFHKVVSNMHLLLHHGFHVKLNVVVMKGVNDDEIIDFVQWTRDYPLHIRFIEFMPFKGNAWNENKLFTFAQMMERVTGHFEVEPLGRDKNDTAKRFRVPGYEGTFAFINTMSEPFCGDCNRIRLTADGKLKNCLFSKGETDLLSALRRGEDIEPLIIAAIAAKHEKWGGQQLFELTENRSMISIGG